MSTTYLMENEEEILRLERKTDAAVVEAFATRAGLLPGMRVVDLCCGAGVTTAILGQLAGPSGSAVGIDASEERLTHARDRYGSPTVSFARRDVRQPLGAGPFDFAWVRFALEYFRAEAFSVVENLSRVMAPGGIVCLIDLDHNGLNHHAMPERLEKGLTAAMALLEQHGNFDPYAGRKLYAHLYRLGFTELSVEVGAHHLIYGDLKPADEYNWTRKIEVLARNSGLRVPGYDSPAAFLEDFLAYFRDPARFTYTPVIAAWGRVPLV